MADHGSSRRDLLRNRGAVLAAVLAANTLCGIAFAAAGLRERRAPTRTAPLVT